MKLSLIFIFIVCVSLGREASAQTDEHSLVGLSKIRVLVEELSKGATDCGITRSFIENAVAFPLSLSGIKIVPSTGNEGEPTFYVNASILYNQYASLCIVNVSVQLTDFHPFRPNYYPTSADAPFLKLLLWDEGHLISTGQNGFAQFLGETLNDVAKKFVVDWKIDNQSSNANSRSALDELLRTKTSAKAVK